MAPIAAPVDRHHDEVFALLVRSDELCDVSDGPRRKIGQQVDAWAIVRCRPCDRHAATLGAESKHEDPSALRQLDNRRGRRLTFVMTRTGGAESCLMQRLQCFDESAATPIQYVIVGEDTAIEVGDRQARNIRRVHSIVDALAGPRIPTYRDGGFEIDDPCVRSCAVELRQRVAPDVREIDWPWDRTGRALRQCDIVVRRMHVALKKTRVAGMRQDLIDTAARHDIAT